MKHRVDDQFRKLFQSLPKKIQQSARKNHSRLIENPRHPSLKFKKPRGEDGEWTVRAGGGYRARGRENKTNNEIVWYWIGSHADYEKLLK